MSMLRNKRLGLIGRLSKAGIIMIALSAIIFIGGGVALAVTLGGGPRASSGGIDLGRGLVGHWKMDGNAKDATPNGNDGTVTAAALTADREGRVNSAYSFNSSSSINVPYTNKLTPTAGISFGAWFNANNTTQNSRIISKTEVGGYNLAFNDGGVGLTATVNVNSAYYYVSNNTIVANVWNYAMITFDGSNIKMYVNGVLVSTRAAAGSATYTTNSALCIGAETTGTNNCSANFAGSIDDVRVYDRALIAAEITALYKSYNSQLNAAIGAKGLVGQWPMDGNAKDDTPNGNNGTITGATLAADRKGRANSAYNFNGSTDYIQLQNGINYSFPNTTFSVSLWERNNSSSGNFMIANGASSGGWGLLDGGNVFLKNAANQQSIYTASAGATTLLRDGAWHHVVAVVATSTTNNLAQSVQLYVDGSLDTGSFDHGYTYATHADLTIGKRPAGSLYFNGALDDVRIYDRALTAAEITAQYKSYDSQISLGGAANINLSKGLVGEWTMNGNIKDATPFSHNGVFNGIAPTATTDRKGRANSAYNYTGSTNADKISIASTAWPSSKVSVSTWFKQDKFGNFNNIVTNSWGADGGWLLFNYGSGYTVFGLYHGGQYNVQCTNPPSLNVWHHLVGTYDGITAKIYIDGSVCASAASYSNLALITNATVTIGPQTTGVAMDRSIDDLRIYDRALSPAEVAALYKTY